MSSSLKKSLEEIKASGKVIENEPVEMSTSIFSVKLSKSWGANKRNSEFLAIIYEYITSQWDNSVGHLLISNYITDLNTASMCIVLCVALYARYDLQYAGFSHDVRDPKAFVCKNTDRTHCIIFKMNLTTATGKNISGIALKENIDKHFLKIQHADMKFVVKDTKEEFLYVEVCSGMIRVHYSKAPKKRVLKKCLSCAFCNKEAKLKQCSRCKRVSYCSALCAKQNWSEHKKRCCAPLPKNVSITLDGYEDSYGEPVLSWKYFEFTEEVKCNMSMNALAYFHKITADMIVLLKAKKYCVENNETLENVFATVNMGSERKLIKKYVKGINVGLEWFHTNLPIVAKKLTMPKLIKIEDVKDM